MRTGLYVFLGLTAVLALICGLFAPPPVAILVFCAMAWLTPTYWIAGVVYARHATRAYFIGGLAGGTAPFLALAYFCLAVMPDIGGSWGNRVYSGSWFGEAQFANLIAALYIFSPVGMSFLGGWLSMAVYYSVQPRITVAPPNSPFRKMIPVALVQPRPESGGKQG